MKIKLFRPWTKYCYLTIGRYSVCIDVLFSPFGLKFGWTVLIHLLIIHLVFFDISANWIRCKSNKAAKEVSSMRRQTTIENWQTLAREGGKIE